MALNLALLISGDQSGAKKAVDDTAAGIDQLGKKAQAASGQIAGTGAALDTTAVSAKQMAAALEAAGGDLSKVTPQMLGLAAAADTAAGGLTSAGVAAKETSALSAGVSREFSVLGSEIIRGNFSRIPGSLLVMNERLASTGTGVLSLKSIFGAFGSFASVAFNPYVLGFIAITAGIDLAVKAFGGLAGAIGGDSARIDADLKGQKDLIDQIKGAYDEAKGAASSYGAESATFLKFQAQEQVSKLGADFQSAQGDLLGNGQLDFANSITFNGGPATPFDAILNKFRSDLRAGTADVIAFRTQVSQIASALPAGDSNRTFAATILSDTQKAADVQEALQRSADLLKATEGNAQAAATALGGTADKYTTLGTTADTVNPKLAATAALLASINGTQLPPGADPIGKGGLSAFDPSELKGYAAGGFTGHSPADRVAGFVHGNEYVFDAASVARIGLSNLEAIRGGVRGYAGGGSVGGTISGGGSSVFGSLADDIQTLRGGLKGFFDDLIQTRNPLQAFASTLASVSSSYLSKALGSVTDLAANLLIPSGGDGLQLGYQAGVLHGGGRVGDGGAPLRTVPAALFARAPRLHSGLAADEYPAILQRGEEVVPRGGRRGGGDVHIWNVETPSPKVFAQSRSQVSRAGARLAATFGRHT